MNTQYLKVAILDLQDNQNLIQLEIGFTDKVLYPDPEIKESIENTLDYWTSSTAITDGFSYSITWKNENTLILNGEFWRGSFNGDLTHRNALTCGDEKFNIGLVNLFHYGYTPKTKRGYGVEECSVIPLYIKCIYADESHTPVEKWNVLLKNHLKRLVDEIQDTISKM